MSVPPREPESSIGRAEESGGGALSGLVLRLYVAAAAPNSELAIANLRRCLERLGRVDYSLEVIDCLSEPARALEDGVLVTPTLVRVEPAPAQTIVGTLRDPAQLTAVLVDDASERSGTYD